MEINIIIFYFIYKTHIAKLSLKLLTAKGDEKII